MNNPSKNYLRVLLVVFAAIFFFANFLSISHTFSPFFAWDMDQVTLLDSLLILGGRLPSHIHHPGFGMYFIASWAHRIGVFFDYLSFATMKDVASAINPMLGIAELSTYLRGISPFLCISIPFLLWLSIVNIFSVGIFFSFLLFLFFSTQVSLFFHAGLIRSELYAVFFWSFAILLLSFSLTATKKNFRVGFLFIAGALLAMAMLSKLQALFYVLATPILYLLISEWSGGNTVKSIDFTSKFRNRLASFNLGFAILLVICSLFRNPYGTTYTNSYPLNTIGIIFMLIPLLLFLGERKKLPKALSLEADTIAMSHILMIGFFCAFFLHFIVIFPPAVALKYMLLDAKMLFFRTQARQGELLGFLQVFNGMKEDFYFSWPTYLATIFLFPISLIRSRSIREKKLVGLLFVFILLCITYGIRATFRDILWLETITHFTAAVFFIQLWNRNTTPWKYFSSCIAVAFILLNLHTVTNISTAINASAYKYNRDWDRFVNATQTGEQEVYTDLMREKFGIGNSVLKEKFIEQALRWRRIRDQSIHQFPSHKIDLTRIGLLQKNFPVWKESKNDGYVFEEIPQNFIGLQTVDAWQALPTHTYLNPLTARNPSDNPNVLVNDLAKDSLAAFQRIDLNIYLAVDNSIPLKNDYLQLLPEKIVVSKGAERITMQVYRLLAYEEFNNLPRRSLWIIEQLYLPR